MRQAWILISLVAALALPSFSQNHLKGEMYPSLDSLPDEEKAPVSRGPASEIPKNQLSIQLKKEVDFIQLEHYSKKLLRETRANITELCGESQVQISGMKSLIAYLEKRQISDLNQVNRNERVNRCALNLFACVFRGEAGKVLKKFIHHEFFKEFLIEKRGWKPTDAQAIQDYLLKIEDSTEELKEKS